MGFQPKPSTDLIPDTGYLTQSGEGDLKRREDVTRRQGVGMWWRNTVICLQDSGRWEKQEKV